jgi:flavodoxin
MKAAVIYDSEFGNTGHIARAIAAALTSRMAVRLASVTEARLADFVGLDLLVMGAPTQRWGPRPEMAVLIRSLPHYQIVGISGAVFDTRLQAPRWLTGSAAGWLADQLDHKGVALILPPESFFVKTKLGPLYPGELERAGEWARLLSEKAVPVLA